MVSVLMATSPGSGLAPAEERKLERLITQAEGRLEAEMGRESGPIGNALRSLAEEVAQSPTAHGLALFAGAGVLEAYRLPLTPRDREVIDPTFATRDLHRAVLENPPYRILVLAAGTARLFVGTGRELRPRSTQELPIEASRADVADRRGHLHQADRGGGKLQRLDSFLRQADRALDADPTSRDLPMVVAAAEPLASRYRRRSSHQIVGVVAGNHERSSAARLAQLARPVIDQHLKEERDSARAQLERAVGGGRSVSGIDGVWRAAQHGRIMLLLVDPTYAYPATVDADGRSLTPSEDPTHPSVLDDAVDEVIEAAALRGGSICFTPLDPDHGGIAAILSTT